MIPRNLHSAVKRSWRARIIENYQLLSNNQTLPRGQVFFTLGGPVHAESSEYDYFVRQRQFIQYPEDQYISVEHDRRIHESNLTKKKGIFLHGQFQHVLHNYLDVFPSARVAIVNADLMCGVLLALPVIRSVFRTMQYHPQKTMLVFNILQSNRWRENQGKHFPEVKETVLRDPVVSFFLRRGAKLIDQFPYESKTVGINAGNSVLITLIFSYAPMNTSLAHAPFPKQKDTTMSTKKTVSKSSKKATTKKVAPKTVSKSVAEKRSAAGVKSWQTRRANQKKAAKKS
jgi:hypothetical protein